MSEYPRYLIKAILGFWVELESVKYKVTSPLTVDARVKSEDDSDFYAQEGNTLRSKAPQTTRIPTNSNARIENLSVLMADISTAINKCLSLEEAFSVRVYCMLWAEADNEELNLSEHTQTLAKQSLGKLGAYLNQVGA